MDEGIDDILEEIEKIMDDLDRDLPFSEDWILENPSCEVFVKERVGNVIYVDFSDNPVIGDDDE